MEEIAELFHESQISKVLLCPVVAPSLKFDVVNHIMEYQGADLYFRTFIKEVILRGRTKVLVQLSEAFNKIVEEEQGVITADIYSPISVAENVLAEIEEYLSRKFGKKVYTRTHLDRSLLGGVLIKIGNSRLDLSLRHKIETLVLNAQSQGSN